MKLFFLLLSSIAIYSKCNQHNGQDNNEKLKDTVSQKREQTTNEIEDSTDDQELINIVNDFKKLYNKNFNIDTSFTRNSDSFRFIFNYRCLFDNGLKVPEKYVSMYGLKSFNTHNFIANLSLYKNNSRILNEKISKSTFNELLESNLQRYGALLYPSFNIEDSIIRTHFSISIPLTDVGVGVNHTTKINGATYINAD